ncbi:hypothetical protein Gasu2_70250 [Galdieria sulphuraria]|uniref:Uncharacterized protein n=1 Tax=Galdieria sulphuraria TaxID=130081 RepID=M2XQN6_GALSU|nr:uncharacterized protein Gasu_03210 [Galdieria sulphuraria]EME32547.1 hypothetical protein Gasu_03210 [Galdieria sulphuraria]GJD12968.1 hypothetical protein Gasu2_70250 [Galdieria sulphuraria]|eukprot:XP_005709067.1 hypothetical protein Gasu_03210 [Galdieria sulphuraria]
MLRSYFYPVFSFFRITVKWIRSYLYGVSFLYLLNSNREVVWPVETIFLQGIKCYLILPKKIDKNRSTVILVHGLSPSGIDDPRILEIGKIFALHGAICLIPTIEPLKSCSLSITSVDIIEQVVYQTANNAYLCPCEKVSIFAASISASICLVASSRPSISKLVINICCIGAYADTRSMLKYVIESNELPDDYGRSVFFFNFVELSFGPQPQLKQALWYRILDGHRSATGTKHELLNKFLSDKQLVARQFHNLWNNSDLRSQCAEQILLKIQDRLNALSPLQTLGRIKCPCIILVHGCNDPVIPSIHSRLLYQELKKNPDVRTYLCLTPFLSHGDKQKLAMSAIGSLLHLLGAFSVFYFASYIDNSLKR